MNVSRVELVSALKNCLPGIDSGGAILEGADSFVFKNGSIFSYNDKISVSIESPVKDLEGTVKAKEFFSILTKLKGEDIKFSAKPDKWIIKCGAAKVELSLLDQEIYSKIASSEEFNEDEWKDLPEGFTTGLSACKFGCNRSPLSGIFISENHITSTDEIRINWFTLKKEMDQFWINDPTAGELMKFTDLVKYRVGDAWVHFKNETGARFSCRKLMDEKYPYDRIKGFMEKKYKKSKDDFSGKIPADFLSAIDRASSFSSDVNGRETVTVTFSSKNILIESSRVSGKFQEKVTWPKGEEVADISPIEFIIDPTMIGYGVKRGADFYLKEGEEGKPGFIVFSSDGYLHLMTTVYKGDE